MEGRHNLLAAGVLALTTSGAWALEGDPLRAEQHLSSCIGCHGIPGYRTAFPSVYSVPKLGGQHEAYLVKALQAYRDGTRSHPSMQAIAASLSDQDMADLAAYYATPAGGR
jgi:cytochrome c553